LAVIDALAESRLSIASNDPNLIKRGLRRPEFLIVDGAPGLDKAIAVVWDGVLRPFAADDALVFGNGVLIRCR
jgi:hypothetical protein